jgi:hypothetical protein
MASNADTLESLPGADSPLVADDIGASPFRRAWELALVAVSAPAISRLHVGWVSEVLAVSDLLGIAVSALVLNSLTPCPGSAGPCRSSLARC